MSHRHLSIRLTLIASVILLFVSATSTAIEFVDSVDEDECSFVTSRKCHTKSKNVYEKCKRWHIATAGSFKATHIVLTDYQNRDSFLFFGDDSTMDARYYNCSGNRDSNLLRGDEVTSTGQKLQEEKVIRPSESNDTNASVKDDIGSEPDWYTELMKLDDLRKKGILTEEEFDAEKKKLLEMD